MARKGIIERKKLNEISAVQARATKRLMRDLKEIQEEPLPGVAAAPLENNLFLWHANLAGPKSTPWEGGIFHFTLHFSSNYPDSPPILIICTKIPHPNVIDNRVCLDMLEDKSNPSKYEGWSPAYSVQTILIQLQAFLFESSIQKVMSDIEDPKEYEKEKSKWIASVHWAVQQSLGYQDPSVKHFPPRAPWPPLPDEKRLASVKSKTSLDIIKSELVCFHTKQTYEQDCLGVGIKFTKNLRTGEIKSITSPLDLISLRAFMNHKLMTSAANEKFTHWLPVFIDPQHGQKAMHLAKRALSMICTGNTKSFHPDQVLHVLPKLMCSMVVEVMQGKTLASVKYLHGYCHFHRLFLAFVEEYPELRHKCTEKVKAFITDENARHKDVTPNLGELLPLIAATDFTWKDIQEAYLSESFSRNAFWILAKYPELENPGPMITDEDKLKYSWEVAQVGHKLLWFNIFFLENVAHPAGVSLDAIIKSYDSMFGRPAAKVEDMFMETAEKIRCLTNYPDFFQGIGKNFTPKQIVDILESAIKESKRKGYHGAQVQVLSPEEFAKQNHAVDLDKLCVIGDGVIASALITFIWNYSTYNVVTTITTTTHTQHNTTQSDENLTLHSNDKQWKEMCEARWGFTELPDYLQSETNNPWRQLFLQNNLQDMISKLNDNPDFPAFYHTLDLSAPHVKTLEITCFEPSNIKSRWYFLTALLTKLVKLETLSIVKGETSLGVQGFKALVKGLNNNQGTLKNLILDYCDIDESMIKALSKCKTLSGNLEKLSFRGNPLNQQGCVKLAEVLREHQAAPHLTELDLSDVKMNAEGAKAIAESLLVKKELKIVKATRNPWSHGMSEVIKNLAYSPSIKEIDISRTTGVLDGSLAKLLKLSVSLEKLNMWQSPYLGLDNNVFIELATNRSLKVLDLGDTKFNGAVFGTALGEALSKNTVLEDLNLESNQIDGNALVAIYEQLKKGTFKLKRLNLDKNPLNRINKLKHASVLGNIMMLAKNLTVLRLNNTQLSEKEWFAQMGEALKPQYGMQLKELHLRQNKLGKQGLKSLAQGLIENTTLELIDISGNDLGPQGAKYLAQIIEKNIGLRTINLYGNFIEIEGAISICQALEKNTTLKKLDIGLNRIRNRGAMHLIKLYESRSVNLERLSLKSNRISGKVALKLAAAIISNPNTPLRFLAMAGNPIVAARSEIASMISKSMIELEFDLAKLAMVKDPERQERTVYLTPLPASITVQMIKKLFYRERCGVCLNVSIHKHKDATNFNSSMYAFVEFAHEDSVKLATALVPQKKNKIGTHYVRIVRAGVEMKDEATKAAAAKRAKRLRLSPEAERGGRGGARGGRGGGRGGARRR